MNAYQTLSTLSMAVVSDNSPSPQNKRRQPNSQEQSQSMPARNTYGRGGGFINIEDHDEDQHSSIKKKYRKGELIKQQNNESTNNMGASLTSSGQQTIQRPYSSVNQMQNFLNQALGQPPKYPYGSMTRQSLQMSSPEKGTTYIEDLLSRKEQEL